MKNHGFTIIEIVIVVIILGLVAALAIPKIIAPNEYVVSSEARHILTVLLGAQKQYQLENAAYATSINNVDITLAASTYFNGLTLRNDATQLASVTRTANFVYTL